MSTLRIGSGLAFTPQRDLALFANMAAKGQRLIGTAQWGHAWRFEDAPAEDVIFDLAYEDDVTQDYFDLFAAAGWTHVLTHGNIHVFKASPGTVALHTTEESRRDELARNWSRFGRWSVCALVALALTSWALRLTSLPASVDLVILLPLFVVAIYTVLPFLGFSWHLARSKARG